jgi:hypothetical protein
VKAPAILAHPNAHPVLQAAGLRPATVAFLGPALAIECPQRAGAHISAAEWSVCAIDEMLQLSYRAPGSVPTGGKKSSWPSGG